MSLIRVWTDIGLDKNVSLLARILSTKGDIFTIQFLSPTEEKDKHGQTIYRYEEETYEIDDDSVTHYLNTTNETDAGFKEVDIGAWIKVDDNSDEDYVPSEEEEDDDDEEEVEDEFEEEGFDEEEFEEEDYED